MKMNARFAVLVVAGLLASAVGTYLALPGNAGVVRPYASGTQTVKSNPGVYDQTAPEYSSSWSWIQQSASFDYYWYVFTSGGTLSGSGHNSSGGGGNWPTSGVAPANVYYFKEYNNEPAGSGHLNILAATYCC
jgi:hypothetical protein